MRQLERTTFSRRILAANIVRSILTPGGWEAPMDMDRIRGAALALQREMEILAQQALTQ
jgi:hypothetical protein